MLLLKTVRMRTYVISIILFLSSIQGFILAATEKDITYVFVSLLFLIISITPFVKIFLYYKKPADILWSQWSDVEGNKADMRKHRASVGELTPIRIDTDLKCATFSGSQGGVYRTTLCKCSCPDFQKRNVPCKHMYYLAAKCNVEKL